MLVAILNYRDKVIGINDYLDAETLDDVRECFVVGTKLIELSSMEDVPPYNVDTEELYYIDEEFVVVEKEPEPEPEPSDDVSWDAMAEAINEGVNEV